MSAKLVALTGATGFIGRHLLQELVRRGYRVRVLLRRPTMLPPEASGAVVGDLTAPRAMAQALVDVDAVIHSAALAHAMSGIPEDDYRAINTEATVALARAAARAGARRFVFLSSIRAQSGPAAEEILTEDHPPEPTDAYGRSKLEAERGLAEIDIDWVALRPVLVYGAGVRGNMASLAKLVRLPVPLPLGGLKARRSVLAVENLVDAVDLVLSAPGPLRRPFIVADQEPLSVAEMVAALRAGLGRGPGLLPVPPTILKQAFRVFGRAEEFERLAGSLLASPAALARLGWQPKLTSRDGLAAFARRFAEEEKAAQSGA
jgi:nucleoside-diphosphate-sugar epimerase